MTEACTKQVDSEPRHNSIWTATPSCPRCLSAHGQWRGTRIRKRKGPIHRRCCRVCGKWFFTDLEIAVPRVLAQAWREEERMNELAYDSWIEAYTESQESRRQ